MRVRAAAAVPRPPRPRGGGPRLVGRARPSSTGSASATAAARRSASWTGRSPRTTRWAPITAWGRTLKDLFQRYKALQGYDQRYQNGFDCQGLWVEVGVERALGPQLEARDRGVRPRRVRRSAARSGSRSSGRSSPSSAAPRHVDGLGQRLLHLLRHEHRVHLALPQGVPRARLAVQGTPLGEWCPRCGTSLSQHELINSYEELTHPSLYVRFPLQGPRRRVARRLDDDAVDAAGERRRCRQARRGVRADCETGDWWAVERKPDATFVRRVRGEELVGLEYEGPFDDLRRRRA